MASQTFDLDRGDGQVEGLERRVVDTLVAWRAAGWAGIHRGARAGK